MKNSIRIRNMQWTDIVAVLAVQSECYTSIEPESRECVEAKFAASPRTCFVAFSKGETSGYLLSFPWKLGHPPGLDETTCLIPQNPDCLYIHDLAVAPMFRCHGVSQALLSRWREETNRLGFRRACLVAVQNSLKFWHKHGFFGVELDEIKHTKMVQAYGGEAEYMESQILL